MDDLPSSAALLRFVAVLIVAVVSAGRADASPTAAELPFEAITLANGLRVVLHEDHRTPQVAVNVRYRVGFSDDPPGKRGLAHLFEHLMLRGSKHVGRDKYFGLLERAGATERNATTSLDDTKYFETLPSNELALALWIESDRMGFFLDVLDQSILDKEKEVVRNEYRTGMLDRPYSFVQRYARNAICSAGHPYHWVVEGEMEDTDAITLDDLRAFFRKHYVPRNATLVIAGDIDRAKAKALVSRYFDSLPAAAPLPIRAATVPSVDGEQRLALESGAEAPRLTIAWPGPPAVTEAGVRLDLVADLLARARGGRLYAALVRGAEIADRVSLYADGMGVRHGQVRWLDIELKKGTDPARALAEVDKVLEELRSKGPTERELAEAKARHADRLLWSLESVTKRADLMSELDGLVRDPGALVKVQSFAAKSSVDAVRETAATWLSSRSRVVTTVTHTRGAPVGGRLVLR